MGGGAHCDSSAIRVPVSERYVDGDQSVAVLGGGQVVVAVEGRTGGVSIEHITIDQ